MGLISGASEVSYTTRMLESDSLFTHAVRVSFCCSPQFCYIGLHPNVSLPIASTCCLHSPTHAQGPPALFRLSPALRPAARSALGRGPRREGLRRLPPIGGGGMPSRRAATRGCGWMPRAAMRREATRYEYCTNAIRCGGGATRRDATRCDAMRRWVGACSACNPCVNTCAQRAWQTGRSWHSRPQAGRS